MAKLNRLPTEQRSKFAEKIMEWGNLTYVGLVVAQIVPGSNTFRLGIAAAGIFSVGVAYLTAYFIVKGGGSS